MGPRHARVLGWAKSYTKSLDQATMTSHDEDAVGAVSIVWSLIQSVMPLDILDCVDDNLANLGLPRLATRNIQEGNGFHIRLGDQVYQFPTAERAPPEAYFSYKYEAWTHTDPAYCKYAFAFCADRTSSAPSNGGSSFVDVGLKVVVQQGTGTVLAFKPQQLHGTTLSHGGDNAIVAITFSRRVSDAWAEASAKGKPLISREKVEGEILVE